MPSHELLSARDITQGYSGQTVLDKISLTVSKEQIITLIGPNGAGKTTLLKILLGLVKPDSGTVSRQTGLRVGYMPQKLQLDTTLPITVERFLQLTRARHSEVMRALEESGVTGLLKTPLQQVSGGELQRVLLARALLRAPQLLVLDEPAQGVDISGQARLYELISTVRDRHHCGVLMVSHDLHLVMAQTDAVICLNHHICCHGTPERVSRDPAFIELFGRRESESLAIYHHDHDHQHDLHGDVVDEHRHCQHD